VCDKLQCSTYEGGTVPLFRAVSSDEFQDWWLNHQKKLLTVLVSQGKIYCSVVVCTVYHTRSLQIFWKEGRGYLMRNRVDFIWDSC